MNEGISRRLYEALADITADALAMRTIHWASVEQAKELLDEVYCQFEKPRSWPPEARYPR